MLGACNDLHRTTLPVSAYTLKIGKPAPTRFQLRDPRDRHQRQDFEEHGLSLEVVSLGGSAKLHQAMVAGSIDIAIGAGTDFLFIAKGAPELGIAAMAGPPSIFTSPLQPVARSKTVADLKGKKVSISSVGSLSEWFVQQIAIRQGWNPRHRYRRDRRLHAPWPRSAQAISSAAFTSNTYSLAPGVHTPPTHCPMFTLRVRNCCWLPMTVPSIAESAMKPPLAHSFGPFGVEEIHPSRDHVEATKRGGLTAQTSFVLMEADGSPIDSRPGARSCLWRSLDSILPCCGLRP